MPLDTSRVEELFHAAQQITSPDKRQVWLATACAGDETLRSRVEALLGAADEASQFLNRPALEIAGTAADVTQGFDGSSVQSGSQLRRRGAEDKEALHFLQPSSRPESLGTLGHYEVLEVIGQGGFGIVLRAFDEKLHRVVALKVLAPELAANGSARKRFIREARTAAAVKNEHVVSIYGVEENAQPPYLAMEMIDGKSLQDKIDQQGPLTLTEILRIGLQMSEGLAAAHKQGLVHRDIKPANILLENGVERVKITDFGLARAVDDASVTQSGTVAGTPMYMSPEQAEGLAIDHRSDLFSLGTVLYAMCTGHSAFRGSGTHAVLKRVIEAAPRPIREVNQDVPEWLCDIIAKLHAKRPEDRFQTALEVAELLGQHLAHLQQPSQTSPPARVIVPPGEVDQKHDKLLSGSIALLSTIRAIMVYSVVISCVIFLGTWFLDWHIRTVVRVGSVLFGFLVLACVGLAVYAMRSRRTQWARALEESAIAFGVLTFAFSMVTLNERLSPIPKIVPVPAVLSIEFNNPKTQFRIDGHGANQTAVSNYQVPLESGEHYLWLKLNDVELETSKFPVFSGQQASLEVSMAENGASATFNGKLLPMRQLAGPAVAVQLEGGSISLPGGKGGWPPDFAGLAKSQEKWLPLFNGKDLTGWKSTNRDATWTWQDGVLTFKGKGDLLVTERNDYQNFHLRVSMKSKAGSGASIRLRNSDEMYGSRYLTAIRPGNQANTLIGGGLTVWHDKQQIGLAENAEVGPADQWHTLEVIANGNRLRTFVDGKPVADVTDKTCLRGSLALSMLNRVTQEIHFKDIEIKELPAEESGWVKLFNGQDLTGWKTHPDKPGDWRVENDLLTGSGEQSHLFSERGDYENFHLRAVAKISQGGNSGIFFRSEFGPKFKPLHALEVELASASESPTGTVHRHSPTFGLYRAETEPTPHDTWFTLEIIARGKHIITKVDGKQSKDIELPDPVPRKGHVALQVHVTPGTVVQFKSIEIKELPAAETGFVPLFNHKDLHGWGSADITAWRVRDGVLIGEGKEQFKLLLSERTDYSDFHLIAEVKASEGASSGVWFRYDPKHTWQAYEANIASADTKHQTGSLLLSRSRGMIDLLTSVEESPVKTDEWFTLEVIAQGKTLTVKVNGETTATYREATIARGQIGLEPAALGSQIQFRKVEIKELPPAEASFVPLFNGQDLTGWKTHPDEPSDWKVDNGALIGANKPSYLYSERGDYTDFHLRCEVQINGGGDGGILVRSPFVLAGKTGMPAYEAQISAGKPTNFGWGTGAIGTTTMKLGWHPLKEAWTDFPADTWVPMEVIVRGNTIETRIAGKTVVEYTDADRLYMSGHIALQQAGDKTRMQFRKLEIKELAAPADDSAEAAALRESVAARERNRDTARRQVEAEVVSPLALIKADCEWIDARIRLAESKASLAEVIWLFREELIPKITEEQRLVSERVKAGVEPVSALNAVDGRLADAKVRFVRASMAMLEKSGSQRQAPRLGRP